MKTVFAILAVLVVASVAFAQAPQGTTEGVVIKHSRLAQGPEGMPPPPPPNGDFVFIATESFGGKVVKGAPYSGEAVTESVQVLGDGNRIVNKFTSTVYRDSEGRTRRDQTLKGLGVLGTGNEPLQTIFINDPVAGVTYSLDSRSHIARKSTPFKLEFTQKPGVAGVAGGAGMDTEGRHFEFRVASPDSSGNVIMTAPLGPGTPPQPGARIAMTQTEQLNVGGVSGTSSYVFRRTGGPNANEKKEDLGKQTIEGVEAEGARTTVTIPAGEIGNERPIEIVSERWYSPELQLVVMTRHSDPRQGETTYKLTNINRTEPAKSLFEVPSDYTIKEGMQPGAPLPARVKKLANPE
jgi:hypothetical protein